MGRLVLTRTLGEALVLVCRAQQIGLEFVEITGDCVSVHVEASTASFTLQVKLHGKRATAELWCPWGEMRFDVRVVGSRVKLMIEAPRQIRVLRQELLSKE